MRFNVLPRSFAQIVLACVLALFAVTSTSGQAQNQAGERGFNPGKSYAVSDIETIGLYSGNVMVNMPLGSLPSGRGGMSGGIALNYNSKIWDTEVDDVIRFTTTHYKKVLVASPEGGWHYNYKYYLKLDYRNLGSQNGACTSGVEDSYTIIKVQLISPDGAQHTMHPGNTATIGTDEFTNLYPDGQLQCSPGAVTPGQIVTFYSKDNTFLRLEVLTDSDTNWENNTWTLYMADGSKVAYNPNSSTRQTITDKNGNYIQIIENATDSAYSNHKTTYLKDQFDRKVVIEYNAAIDEDRIHSKGTGGADLTTRVTWKYVGVTKSYFACEMAPSPLDQNAWENYPVSESFRMVDKIYLPTQIDGNLFYDFDYNADGTTGTDTGWGEISQITMPSGATGAYEYFYDNVSGTGIDAESVLLNRPIEKNLTYNKEYDGSSQSVTETWAYTPIAAYNALPNLTGVTVTGPDGGTTTEHYAAEAESGSTFLEYMKGEVYKSELAGGTLVEKAYKSNAPISPLVDANRFVKYEFTSITDAAGNPTKTAIKEYSHDKNGNVTEVREYDFVAYSSIPRNSLGRVYALPSGITPIRISKTEYYNGTPDASSTTYTDTDSYHTSTSPRLLGLAKAGEVQNGTGTPKTRSEMTYDFTSYSSNTIGGNLTASKTWDSFKGGAARAYSNPLTTTNSIGTSVTYNSYGMPLTTTDANGVVTSLTYGNVLGPNGNVTGLYPTQTVRAYGSALASTSSAVFDFYTGLATSATDVDNNVTSATVYDDLGRPTKSITAQGTLLEVWTQTEYHDANRFAVVKSDLETKGDGKKVGTQFYDQLGRVRLSKTLENVSQSAINETDGIKVQTRYTTSGTYSYQLSSNPYRAAISSAASSEATMGWTRSKTINTGKHSEVETFSGATLPQPFLTSGYNTNSTGVVQTDTDANATTVTDQAGKLRRSITNGLGQLVRVDEPNSSNQIGTVGSPNQDTGYAYDTLNNLTTVTQGSQTRSFTYSSLSRLLTATNPESGTISYAYDSSGNLTSKLDARSITTSYTYDALSRVTNRAYLNEPTGSETPDVVYTYGTVAPAIGKLTKVTSPVSTTEYTAFDILGRVTAHKQTTDGNDYTTAYAYNLSGAMIEETYPSTRKVKTVLDADGDLSVVQSKKNAASGYWNYANSFNYNAAGAITSMQLGNGKWESTVFNSRLQPTQIALGTVQNGYDKLKLNYSYGDWNGSSIDTAKNNGNIIQQVITVPTVGTANGFTATQKYYYDLLNRIDDATEDVSGQTWRQDFTYDRYGNRNFVEASTTTLPKNCGTSPNFTVCSADVPVYNPSINSTTNKNQLNGYTFDAAGNTTKDAESRKFKYDGENKQVKVETVSSGGTVIGTVGEYIYDGDGKRIKKKGYTNNVLTEETIFVYDAAGKLVAEYSSNIASINDAKVAYLTNDHLGSPRINTDQNGNVTTRHDYHPFGEETASAQRIAGLGYADDVIRKQFTGYEKDGESGLEFAQARYYSVGHGRFTSVDPLLASASIINPQTFNRYSYTLNNPTNWVDPSGLLSVYSGSACGQFCQNSDSGMGSGAFNSAVNGGFSLSCWCVDVGLGEPGSLAASFRIWYGSYDESNPQSADPHFDKLAATFHYRELAGSSGGLNDRGQALIQEMGRWGPILQKTTNTMGALSIAIIAAPVVADAAASAAAARAAAAAAALLKNISIDGPDERAGRIVGARWKKSQFGIRLDYHSFPGDQKTKILHINVGSLKKGNSLHIPLFDPRWFR